MTLMDPDIFSFSHHLKLDVTETDRSVCSHYKDKRHTDKMRKKTRLCTIDGCL